MSKILTFDDVLIVPQFSTIKSRRDTDLQTSFATPTMSFKFFLPIISANMDTITDSNMAIAMGQNGGLGCLHRFWNIEPNVEAYLKAHRQVATVACSIGLGDMEISRAEALYGVGARVFILDVAHGAQEQVAQQYITIKKKLPNCFLIVGNFATGLSKDKFIEYVHYQGGGLWVDSIKVGVGPGSACTTRIKTGVGYPQLGAIIDCIVNSNYKTHIIADGGCRTSGDIAKALAAGADMVMLGSMLAGTSETPGITTWTKYEQISGKMSTTEPDEILRIIPTGTRTYQYVERPIAGYKTYRGSASKESYEIQGKDWACSEGESFTIPYKGSVINILAEIEGGLRSAMSYVGANNLTEFKEKATFIEVTNAGVAEGKAHGKTN